jgi:hypothetical protein
MNPSTLPNFPSPFCRLLAIVSSLLAYSASHSPSSLLGASARWALLSSFAWSIAETISFINCYLSPYRYSCPLAAHFAQSFFLKRRTIRLNLSAQCFPSVSHGNERVSLRDFATDSNKWPDSPRLEVCSLRALTSFNSETSSSSVNYSFRGERSLLIPNLNRLLPFAEKN